MTLFKSSTLKQKIALLSFALLASFSSQATIVQFDTSVGTFEVNLYDDTTPKTVENFLAYVNAGDYSNVIIHRSIAGFIVQGGGFAFDTQWPVSSVAANASVVNEPVYSNVRGTIAMAKLGGQPNSATNQWFINLVNNAQTLDPQNGGFTVFGEVTGDGMGTVDQIAATNTYNLGGAFTDIPLDGYTAGNDPEQNNLIIISNITIIDSTISSASGLNPTASTYNPSSSSSSSGGGGAIWLMTLLAFGLVLFGKKK